MRVYSAAHGVRAPNRRAQVAGALARGRAAQDPDRSGEAEVLRARHVPVPVGRRPARRPPRGLHRHRHRRRYKRMQRLQRAAPDGLGRLRPARRAVRDQDRHPPARSRRRRTSPTSGARSRRSASPTTGTREVDTTDPGYFTWTQWIFLQLFERGLAYQAEVPVNWCPALGTVLANEEVIDGKSERGGHPVDAQAACGSGCCGSPPTPTAARGSRRARLARRRRKAMQRNWIGRSEGAEVDVPRRRPRRTRASRVFTTRPDTLFGATYMVLAPEHPLVAEHHDARAAARRSRAYAGGGARARATSSAPTLAKDEDRRVHRRVRDQPGQRRADPDLDRRLRAGELRHRRDHGRARRTTSATSSSRRSSACRSSQVVQPADGSARRCRTQAFTGDGVARELAAARRPADAPRRSRRSSRWLEARGSASGAISYRLRDWLFSRQRYWGEPFPLVHCPTDGVVPVPESELPVRAARPRRLQADRHAASRRSRRVDELGRHDLPDVRRPGDARDQHDAAVGGLVLVLPALPRSARTTTRAWSTREARSTGCRSTSTSAAPSTRCCTCSTRASGTRCCTTSASSRTKEPFQKLRHQGTVLAYIVPGRDGRATTSSARSSCAATRPFLKATGEKLTVSVEKMAKTKLNGVNPDDVIARLRRRRACACTSCSWASSSCPSPGTRAPSRA